MAQQVKNLPAMLETQVQSLCQEDPRRRNGNPWQCSCLGDSMDRGSWQATVMGLQRAAHDLASKYTHTHNMNELLRTE